MQDLETLLAHAGCSAASPTGDLVDPIHLSTTYERGIDLAYPAGYHYTRAGNPTRSALERTLASLEGGADAAAFSSGMAAVAGVLATLTKGAHIVIPDDVYHGVRHVLNEYGEKWSLSYTSTDLSDERALESTIRSNTELIWVETPSNPQLKITDLEMVSRVCRKHNIAWAADGTWTTPLISRPLEFGARYVVHSVTKYLAGHSDVLGGVVISDSAASAESVRNYLGSVGSVLDPFSCWLTLRGLRTLSVRLDRQCENAAALATHLGKHDAIETVLYPSVVTHAGHDIATRQMRQYGAMLSVLVRGDGTRAREIVSATKIFRRATSLGGTESLIEHRRSIEGAHSNTPDNLIRMSIGLESTRALVEDLDAALEG